MPAYNEPPLTWSARILLMNIIDARVTSGDVICLHIVVDTKNDACDTFRLSTSNNDLLPVFCPFVGLHLHVLFCWKLLLK